MQRPEVESRTQGSRPRTQKKIQGQGQLYRGQTLLRPGPRIQRGSDLKKKGLRSKPYVNAPENSDIFQKKGLRSIISKIFRKFQAFSRKKMSSKFFLKLFGVLQDETKLVMTLAHFQQVKN